MERTRTRRGLGARLKIAALILVATGAVVGSGQAFDANAATLPRAEGASPTPSASATGATTCLPTSVGGTTCTGTYGGDRAYDWYIDNADPNNPTGGMIDAQPTVTVDQTTNLTNQIVRVSWTNFTPSGQLSGSSAADPYTGTLPGYNGNEEFYAVTLLECAGTDPQTLDASTCNQIPVGQINSGPAGNEVQSYTLQGSSPQATDCTDVPSDTVCGTGYSDFQVQTKVQNNVLGCDSTHPCSLVVLPIWGGNTNYSNDIQCADHSQDLYWGSSTAEVANGHFNACMWNDRISVPLYFAPIPTQYCPAADYQFTAAGSSALEKAMDQWQPAWCQSSAGSGKVDFDYNSAIGEYAARAQFLSGGQSSTAGVDTALVTDPASSALTAGSSRRFTYAPVATTGISIAYYIDDGATQEPVTDLRLDARLVAKLLTQSYSLLLDQCSQAQQTQQSQSAVCDPAVAGNPQTIFDDPEFYQLNPEYTKADFTSVENQVLEGQFLPIVMSDQSDLTWELTRWVASDPDAEAFLEGKPDPWGMHVNTNYEKIGYPQVSFVEQDPGWTDKASVISNNPWYKTMQEAWVPITGVDNVAADLAYWQPSDFQFIGACPNNLDNPQPPCAGGILPNNPKQGALQFPERGMFAIMDSATAANYRFPTAALVNPAGNAVGPTTESMSAAVAAMKTNPDGITQYQDFGETSPNAYPLTEVQYAMVPTCGLPAAKADAVASFLTDVAGSQTYGITLGQLPPWGGYLALNAAQQAKTLAAVQAVRSQNCQTTGGDQTVSGKSSGSGGGGGATNPTGPGTNPNENAAAPSSPAPTANATHSANPSASSSAPVPVGFGDKAADTSSDLKYILPAALAAGALLAIGGPLAYAFGTGGLRRPRLRLPWGAGPGSAASSASAAEPTGPTEQNAPTGPTELAAPVPEAAPPAGSQSPDGGGLDG